MEAFLISFGIIFVAELGDKSQLMAMTFAARHRAVTILIAITAATAFVHLFSVLIGAAVGVAMPTKAISVVAGIAFLGSDTKLHDLRWPQACVVGDCGHHSVRLAAGLLRDDRVDCQTRSPSGGFTLCSIAIVTNRASASVADTRRRGCHSCHCSASQRRDHSWTRTSRNGVCHDSGSPVVSSNRPPAWTACSSRPR